MGSVPHNRIFHGNRESTFITNAYGRNARLTDRALVNSKQSFAETAPVSPAASLQRAHRDGAKTRSRGRPRHGASGGDAPAERCIHNFAKDRDPFNLMATDKLSV